MTAQRFRVNYDRHGGEDWCVTTWSPAGRPRHRLTRWITLLAPVIGSITVGQQPAAAFFGYGHIEYTKKWTRITRRSFNRAAPSRSPLSAPASRSPRLWPRRRKTRGNT